VSIIVRLGGVAVLAHPGDLNDLDALLIELKAAGLTGIEVYYQDYDEPTIQRLLQKARRYDLFPLGGSDYHGIYGERERLPGEVPIPDEAIEAFMALARSA
jgi:predicted metal-dependent phosphoesterase TrpH